MPVLESAFLTRVGASLTASVLTAGGSRWAKKLRTPEKEKALGRCMEAGLTAFLATIPEDGAVGRDHLQDLLEHFARQEEVHEILADLLKGDRVAASELVEAFGTKYDLETLPGLDLAKGLSHFAVAFRDCAIGEKELQGTLQTGQLIVQTEILQEMRDGQRRSEERMALQSTHPDELRTTYLNHLFEDLRKLSLEGVDPALAQDSRARLDLDGVYTALLTRSTADTEPGGKRPRRGGAGPREELLPPRRLSALEQLDRHEHLVLLGDPGGGKSTFVHFVGLCLAGEALRRPEANLKVLTEPLPSEGETEMWVDDKLEFGRGKPTPQPWSHGPLLPVRVVLRDFAARGLPAKGKQAGAADLWKFIAAKLDRAELGDYAEPLKRELREAGGIVLLDGLDEVPEAEDRRVQLKRVVEDFKKSFPRCRLLVTSRIYAYQDQEWRLDDFVDATLAPFSVGQIRRFIERWYQEVKRRRGLSDEDARGKAALLERAVFGNPRLLALAERPLLLTLMASLHAWRGGSLPQDREQLYADAVELLMTSWESQRVVHGEDGEPVIMQPSLSEYLNADPKKIRALLEELAYDAHGAQPEADGTADVPEGELLRGLTNLSSKADVHPTRLVEYLRDRAGLLLPRGVGVYTFPHRTFQEYLAACHLTDCEFPGRVAGLARKTPNRWREVLLLAGAKAARGAAFAVWQLAAELSIRDPAEPGATEEDAWGALLAGQLLAESAALDKLSEANRQQLEGLRWRLVHVLRGAALPTVERAAAGRALSVLGDPREEVTTLDGMEFCWVPAGRFRMGEEKFDDEKPAHDLEIPYGYWMARYPVTVEQFRRYVAESGVTPGDKDSLKGVPNEPVGWVSWHEAVAFCRWLTERWRQAGRLPAGWSVRLPSEAEWEKAARGGFEVPVEAAVRRVGKGFQVVEPELQDNPARAREYPWQGDFSPELANSEETELGATSAVGCFAGGVSPYGCEEMAGNVWEWTQSYWTERHLTDEAPDESLRVVRGGSFFYLGGVRCAARSGDGPDLRSWDLGFRVVSSPSSSAF